MCKKLFFFFFFFLVNIHNSNAAVVAHDEPYYKYTQDNIQIIYTKDNLPFAKQTASVETPLNRSYEKYFDWKLDETLYVGLISCNNQIANGFSTQWPNNRQINYIGGAMNVDYFASTSWLHTLLYHETSHNYQLNVKESIVSQILHTLLGNGYLFFPLYFTVPNVMENPFMLEGNAVFNESWHGNGGRLYNGRFKAETILQAKAGNIIPSDVYNTKLAFPYSNIAYIQGSFFNLFLAQKYGIYKLNSYFKFHSQDFFWPLYTNASMEAAIGVDFENSLSEFANYYKELSQDFIEAEGEHLVSSVFFTPLSNSDNEIFFIINESGVGTPELVVIEKNTLKIKKAKESWVAGKVIKTDGDYYTQASLHTSPIKIEQGLFCNQGFIKEGTASKVVQGYLSDKRAVYFDVNSSFSQPQLYVGDEFYSQVNSSVVIDSDDNLYYFKQDKKQRTLYKNKTPLYSYEGFYGIVSGVDSKGVIYFIANSKLGSTLYSFNNGEVKRASKADNIVEARLIDDNEVFVAAMSEKDYYYTINTIEKIDQTPYETKLFFEDKEYYGGYERSENSLDKYQHIDLSNSYSSFLDMHHSATNIDIGYKEDGGVVGSLNVEFGDPLSQNAARVFLLRDESNVTLAGASYKNSQYLLSYSLSMYGVIDNQSEDEIRDYGVFVASSLPFYNAGYLYGALGVHYFQDYTTLEREPLSTTLTLMLNKQYGISMYPNFLNYLQLYGLKERGDTIVGANYKFSHYLFYELYLSLEGKYSYTDTSADKDKRGVKLTEISYDESDMDPSVIYMPSFDGSVYVKQASYIDIGLQKVFNYSLYFFTFPYSLQREAIYSSYRHYNIEGFSGAKYTANELKLGLTLSSVFLNTFEAPISLEYIYNDADFIEDRNSFQVRFGIVF